MWRSAFVYIFTVGSWLAPQSAWALSHWECKGLTADTAILTPYQDGTVNLSFNKGGVAETSHFSHHGNIFTVFFRDISGVKGASLIYIIDTVTREGYEAFEKPGGEAGAAKMICFWFDK
jgi:hypothetical protein